MSDQKPTGKYAPLSAWQYFGLTVLFSIPVVGFIFLIIFSISPANINRRSFARSYWCGLILCIIIATIVIITTGGTAALLALFNK